jgi:hypothetical protein
MSGNKMLARKLRIINYKQKSEHWYLKTYVTTYRFVALIFRLWIVEELIRVKIFILAYRITEYSAHTSNEKNLHEIYSFTFFRQQYFTNYHEKKKIFIFLFCSYS